MSLWRKEAIRRLPELQKLITDPEIDNPMRLWIELHWEFGRLCEQQWPPIELLRKIWAYAKWCLYEHNHPDVLTAAAYGFCEHLLDTQPSRELLPDIMGRQDYVKLKTYLLYHNSEEEYRECLKRFD